MRDSIKDQIANRKSKPVSRFVNYSSSNSENRSVSSKEDIDAAARRRRLRYFSRRRL